MTPRPAIPSVKVLSVTVPTVVPSMAPEIVWPLRDSARWCQVPVPSAATLPLASVVIVPLVLLRRIDHAPVSETRR